MTTCQSVLDKLFIRLRIVYKISSLYTLLNLVYQMLHLMSTEVKPLIPFILAIQLTCLQYEHS